MRTQVIIKTGNSSELSFRMQIDGAVLWLKMLIFRM